MIEKRLEEARGILEDWSRELSLVRELRIRVDGETYFHRLRELDPKELKGKIRGFMGREVVVSYRKETTPWNDYWLVDMLLSCGFVDRLVGRMFNHRSPARKRVNYNQIVDLELVK